MTPMVTGIDWGGDGDRSCVTEYAPDGRVISVTPLPSYEEERRAHESGKCLSDCTLCYQEACDHLTKTTHNDLPTN